MNIRYKGSKNSLFTTDQVKHNNNIEERKRRQVAVGTVVAQCGVLLSPLVDHIVSFLYDSSRTICFLTSSTRLCSVPGLLCSTRLASLNGHKEKGKGKKVSPLAQLIGCRLHTFGSVMP